MSLPLHASNPGGGYLGASIGTPGLLNGHFAVYGSHFGFRGSLCFLNIIEALDEEENASYDDINEPWMFAAQTNFELNIFQTENFLFTIGLVGGTFYARENYEAKDVFALYGGAALGVIFYGLYLELGVAYISDMNANLYNYDKNYIPLIQLGYMWSIKGN